VKLLLLLLFTFLFLLLQTTTAFSQSAQVIRGKVIDKESDFPLTGVNIIIKDSNPVIGTSTNENGEFSFKKLPVGKYTILFRYLGYKPAFADIELTAGKQQVLRIEMEEQVTVTDEVVVKAYRKGETINKMASVSARSFTVAETEQYAGSFGDPARMAANFAGVSRAGDDRNDIVIRGNSPMGLQWRLQGMNIPSPNHWSASGATGGPVSILNNNTLSNSDFFTGAFPAQYGNALSGVFDLWMRNGNNQKYEFTGQIGFGGFELMAEGPFSKNYNGSFLISGRYSVLDVMDMLGFDVAGGAVPEYYDLTFKVDLPTKKAGKLSIFGIGGKSYIEMISYEDEDIAKFNPIGNTDVRNGSSLGILGVTHKIFIDKKSHIYTTLSLSGTKVESKVDSVKFIPVVPNGIDTVFQRTSTLFYGEDNSEIITSASSRYVRKFNRKNTLAVGVGFETHNISYQDSFRRSLTDTAFYQHSTAISKNGLSLINSYVEWQHKFSNTLTLNTGVYFQQFLFNNSNALEPRLSLTYEPLPTHKFSIGFGMHSKLQPMFYYFVQSYDTLSGKYMQTNRELEFTKATHLVFAYDHMFTDNLHLKIETYYQWLYNVPVTKEPSNFSMLNDGASFHIHRVADLVNKGTGNNYGVEITFERYLSKNWYFMITNSLFDSWYRGSDNVKHHTAFAANYVTNFLGGYEYRFNSRYSLNINSKITWSGGKRNPYLNEEASMEQGKAVYIDDLAYSEREKDYFKLDFRISLKNNDKKIYQEWALDLTNVTDHKNIYSKTYNPDINKIEYIYQQGFLPMFMYRINF